jgi:protein-S-isoprenylcysteine O-methyltransferase Ste14
VPLLISDSDTARGLLYAAAAAALFGETIATYVGQARSEPASGRGRLRLLGDSLLQTTFFRSHGDTTADRGTKQVLVLSVAAGIVAAVLIAMDVPSLRAGANTWTTLILGVALAAAGVALRIWAVASLGRFFQRDVVIQEDHVVWRGGPYRWVRHPAYAGNLISYFGLGLAIGSWVGAVALLVIAFAGHIPRIRVEEAELTGALGGSYREYAGATARLVPAVW